MVKRRTYKPRPNGNIWVFLDGKSVGTIFTLAGEYRYQPFGGEPGDWFPSLEQCKRSLEGLQPQTERDKGA